MLAALFSILPRQSKTFGTWAQVSKIYSGALFEETYYASSLTWNSVFQQDDVNQCNYFCYVTYYWMETDPDYEFEAPKWFDFTADFEDELNNDSKWVKQTCISRPNVLMYSIDKLYTRLA